MSEFSLQEMLQRRSLPQKPFQLSILRPVAAQLDEAHRRNLVHGHLTPRSIFVSIGDSDVPVSVSIRDFGTKFVLDPAATSASIPLDAYYLSPEQILGINITAQSDEFSFAAIAYEMVTGRKPFDAASVSGLIFAICTDTQPAVQEIDGTLTPGVSEIFNRALAKDREQRYATCGQFMSALEYELARCDGWSKSVGAAAVAGFAEAAATSRFDSGYSPFSTTGNLAAAPPVEPKEWPAWRTEPKFEPTPPRAEYELPPVPRRSRYEEDEEPPHGKPGAKKFAIVALALLLITAGAAFFFNRSPKSELPTQVLDTSNGAVSPPPANNGSESARVQPPATDTAPTPTPQPTSPANEPVQQQTAPQTKAAPPAAEPAKPQAAPAAQQGKPEDASTAPAAAPARVPESGNAGVVELLTEPPGATVVVDNNPSTTCRAPCSLSLRAGRHTLATQMPGYTTAQRIFNVPETTSVFVALAMPTGALVVTSRPSAATILVDGKDFGLTPATLHLPPGQHRITLMNGSQRHDETVTVVADGIQAAGFTFAQ
jgi:Protein kinase domain/PEGA domain